MNVVGGLISGDVRLFTSIQVNRILNLPRGSCQKMAKKGLIPHFVLPNGEIRFSSEHIQKILEAATRPKDAGVA
jgi:predicted site-specific integrase-resolvase